MQRRAIGASCVPRSHLLVECSGHFLCVRIDESCGRLKCGMRPWETSFKPVVCPQLLPSPGQGTSFAFSTEQNEGVRLALSLKFEL